MGLGNRYSISLDHRRSNGSGSRCRVTFGCLLLFFVVAGVDCGGMRRNGSVVVPMVGAASGQDSEPSTGENANNICQSESEGVTVCTCVESEGKVRQVSRAGAEAPVSTLKEASLTFSGPTNQLTLICEGKHVPDYSSTDQKGKVCPADADMSKCRNDGSPAATQPVSLADLLRGENAASINWIGDTASSDNKSFSLTVPGNNLPLSDKAFSVGCMKKSGNSDASCKVTVNLVKLSQTTGNTVECAYGATSNASRQQVTLSPTQNTLTLICGNDSDILPTDYRTHFCSTGNAQESCAETYESIIPQYEDSWWTTSSPENGTYKLAIPSDMFPEEEKRIVVGCKYAQSKAGKADGGGETTSSICNVDVTISASTSAASDASVPSVKCMALSTAVVLAVVFLFLN
ncbi:srs domain-containing protein [Neospora caninum Liverpool]|uniref:Srs domain-containing protein n=1 Tax=Neospora caninum (strain Liverpool) TaxID=572307 RepID=F0V7P6_NEOCL|nr:srs domain-containing protein [Neospora caninum Liverpool]CBZ49737.1 srs domain-containing protein [Neospora caninum Liverpool]CEL64321.1 TPA: SRS domain-containing protein [Neospora caninum Liverpool]|eukprot:XP_003879772.1 srs domain-containing protein [Neospora caninum Liverpool]